MAMLVKAELLSGWPRSNGLRMRMPASQPPPVDPAVLHRKQSPREKYGLKRLSELPAKTKKRLDSTLRLTRPSTLHPLQVYQSIISTVEQEWEAEGGASSGSTEPETAAAARGKEVEGSIPAGHAEGRTTSRPGKRQTAEPQEANELDDEHNISAASCVRAASGRRKLFSPAQLPPGTHLRASDALRRAVIPKVASCNRWRPRLAYRLLPKFIHTLDGRCLQCLLWRLTKLQPLHRALQPPKPAAWQERQMAGRSGPASGPLHAPGGAQPSGGAQTPGEDDAQGHSRHGPPGAFQCLSSSLLAGPGPHSLMQQAAAGAVALARRPLTYGQRAAAAALRQERVDFVVVVQAACAACTHKLAHFSWTELVWCMSAIGELDVLPVQPFMSAWAAATLPYLQQLAGARGRQRARDALLGQLVLGLAQAVASKPESGKTAIGAGWWKALWRAVEGAVQRQQLSAKQLGSLCEGMALLGATVVAGAPAGRSRRRAQQQHEPGAHHLPPPALVLRASKAFCAAAVEASQAPAARHVIAPALAVAASVAAASVSSHPTQPSSTSTWHTAKLWQEAGEVLEWSCGAVAQVTGQQPGAGATGRVASTGGGPAVADATVLMSRRWYANPGSFSKHQLCMVLEAAASVQAAAPSSVLSPELQRQLQHIIQQTVGTQFPVRPTQLVHTLLAAERIYAACGLPAPRPVKVMAMQSLELAVPYMQLGDLLACLQVLSSWGCQLPSALRACLLVMLHHVLQQTPGPSVSQLSSLLASLKQVGVEVPPAVVCSVLSHVASKVSERTFQEQVAHERETTSAKQALRAACGLAPGQTSPEVATLMQLLHGDAWSQLVSWGWVS